MALFLSNINQITRRGTHLFPDPPIPTILLNGAGVFGLTDDNVTESVFLFNLNLEDDREGSVRIESTSSTTDVARYVNADFSSTFVPLTVYEEANPSSNTETQTFLSSSICFGYDFDSGAILYVRHGKSIKRIMVTESILDIIYYVQTTTTTSTSTTSTTSTSTSSTSTSSTSSTSTSTSTTSTTTAFEGDFRVTSGEAVSATQIRLTTTEVPFIPTFDASEWEVLEGGEEVTIDSFALWASGVRLNVTGLVAGSTITVTYSGPSAQSTFGTSLDTFSLMAMTNSVVAFATLSLDDGAYYFRLQARTCTLNMDQTVSATGFSGSQPGDWDEIKDYNLP